MTNPTRQEIINAHDALSEITYLADTYLSSISGRLDETRELRQTILAALHPRALTLLGFDRYWADRITLTRDLPATTLTHRGWL